MNKSVIKTMVMPTIVIGRANPTTDGAIIRLRLSIFRNNSTLRLVISKRFLKNHGQSKTNRYRDQKLENCPKKYIDKIGGFPSDKENKKR